MDRESVRVITYCLSTSYGSILQTLGLKRALLSLEIDSVVDKILVDEEQQFFIDFLKVKSIKEFCTKVLSCIERKRLKTKFNNSNKFIDKYIDIHFHDSVEGLKETCSTSDVFLVGSDQVWNYQTISQIYSLKFVPRGTKKISYAASMGRVDIPDSLSLFYREMLENMVEISVRETDCAKALKRFTDREIFVHIDPTFFLPATEWERYENSYPIQKPYVLVYPLYWNSNENDKLRQLHKRTGKIIVVLGDYYRNIYANKWVFDADVSQFLWLIHHADAVVTSSFHGVALSLNYNKKVAAVINPSAPSRITNLIECLGYRNPDILELAENENYDFTNVNVRIKEETEKGITYLREALQK